MEIGLEPIFRSGNGIRMGFLKIPFNFFLGALQIAWSFLSSFYVNLNGSFTKSASSLIFHLFIFYVLSARLGLASSDLTSSVNTAIPILTLSEALLNRILSCLSSSLNFFPDLYYKCCPYD